MASIIARHRVVMAALRASRWPVLALAAGLAGGCTSEQIYNSARGWRRSECYKLADLAQRERCLKEADRPYDVYRAAKDAN
jgi:hypothetical protein